MKNTNKNEQIHAWKEICECVGTGTETCGCQKMPLGYNIGELWVTGWLEAEVNFFVFF